MSTFKDAKGREWNISVTVSSIKRVIEGTADKLNLCDALDGKLIVELGNDPLKFCEVLFWLLKPQLDEKGIDADDLADALLGDPLGAAVDAFCEALTLFFQRPEQREVLGKLIAKANEVSKRAGRHAVALIESDTMKQKIDRTMSKAVADAEAMLGN